MLKNKTPAECKARWFEYLSPAVKKDQWTPEEEQLLMKLAKALPNQWQTIASQLQRTATACIGKYNYLNKVAMGIIKEGEVNNKDKQQKDDKASGGDNMAKFNYNSRPENRAARPDAHDFDEGERELIQTAQARIANTAGKKEKRRLREGQLKDAKEAAKLAHLRQLEAAGVALDRSKKTDPFHDAKEKMELEAMIANRDTGADPGQFNDTHLVTMAAICYTLHRLSTANNHHHYRHHQPQKMKMMQFQHLNQSVLVLHHQQLIQC